MHMKTLFASFSEYGVSAGPEAAVLDSSQNKFEDLSFTYSKNPGSKDRVSRRR